MLECLGRIFWRELYREWTCNSIIDFQKEPIPSLNIRWLPKNSRFPLSMVSFSGDPQTCQIHPSAYVEGSAPVVVGNGVIIEQDVILATSSHQLRHGQFMRGPIEARPIVIEDDVSIGPRAIICGSVRLGKGCRIQADSVVSSSIPAGETATGVPAKPHLTVHLRNAGLLPASLNALATRTYLTATSRLIKNHFGDQIEIGNDCFFNREVFIHGRGRLRMGRQVFIAPRIELDLTDSSEESIIEDNVWIGAGAKLIAPFQIRKDSVIAAGCHFSGKLHRSGLWGGRPAVLIHGDTTIAHLIHH